ncbi:hypothetical protein ACVILK_003310 [Bradyrhizobium embrapense]
MSKFMNVLMGGVPIGRLEQMDTRCPRHRVRRSLACGRQGPDSAFDVPASRRQEALRREGGQLSLESASGQRPDPAEMGTDLRRVAKQRVRSAVESRRGLRGRDPDRHRRVDGRQRGFARGGPVDRRGGGREPPQAPARGEDLDRTPRGRPGAFQSRRRAAEDGLAVRRKALGRTERPPGDHAHPQAADASPSRHDRERVRVPASREPRRNHGGRSEGRDVWRRGRDRRHPVRPRDRQGRRRQTIPPGRHVPGARRASRRQVPERGRTLDRADLQRRAALRHRSGGGQGGVR